MSVVVIAEKGYVSVLVMALIFVLVPCLGRAQPVGIVEGTLTTADGVGVAAAVVTLEPLRLVEQTDGRGAFAFPRVPVGRYVVRIAVGALEARWSDVRVDDGKTTRISALLPRDFSLSMTTTVSVASRVPEARLDAAAAIDVVDDRTIRLEGGAGQLPSLLQSTAGAEYTQSGVYDIQFNARGFNGTLSRRVQVLLDGRELAAPENKNQEWIAAAFMTPEIDRIEFARGPAAALYGANSINGVVAITTRSPRASPGARASVTLGELDTVIGDVRWAGPLGHDWYARVLANHTRSGSFSQTRTTTTEYPGLPLEIAAAVPELTATSADGRVDRYLPGGRQLAINGGFSHSAGGTYLTQGGRIAIDDSTRAWSSVTLDATQWTARAYINTRDADQHALFAPIAYRTSGVQFKGEVQARQHFAQRRGRLVVGGSYRQEHVDSDDGSGRQSLYLHPVTTKEPALFGQVDYNVSSRLKVLGGLRWDASTLYDAQLSPKVAVVYQPTATHSLRASVSRGFQVGNYTELFLSTPLAAPVDLSFIETALAPILGGTTLDFGAVPVFGFGNPNLDVEEVTSLEAGYAATLGTKARFSVDVYRNTMRDFISDLTPGINPAYPAYQAPSSLPAPVRAVVAQALAGVPGLTNAADGSAQIVYSNGNVGLVRSRGVEAQVAVRPQRAWTLDASYTWFAFTLIDGAPGLEPKPNAPTHRGAVGATYARPRFSASLRHRWVDGFDWASGIFVGPVPAYAVSDLHLLFAPAPHWQLGANISNLFDRRHYEMFGGDVIRRRALAHLTATW